MSKTRIYVLSLLEGVSVLGFELLIGKIINSYFGTSYIVWSSILVITFLVLAIAYKIGGALSVRKNTQSLLLLFFICSPILASLSILLNNKVFLLCSEHSIYYGLIVSNLFLLAPPIFAIGCSTPILIQFLSEEHNQSPQKASSYVFALSSTGGLVISMILGLILIPFWGITNSLLSFSILIIILAILIIPQNINNKIYYLLIGIFIFNCVLIIPKKNIKSSKLINIIYESEGVLGQIKVLDVKPGKLPFPTRRLLINGIPQTYIVNQPTAYSLWNYPHLVSGFASLKRSNSKALLIGIGGGSVARELSKQEFEIDAVEIDPRIVDIANKFFYLNSSKMNIKIDDGRHFIKKSNKKYDLIVYDVLTGETQPNYIFSIEAMKDIKKITTDSSIIIINYQGILNDKNDKAFPSLYKTFESAGFITHYWASNPNAFDDIVFVLSNRKIDFENIKLNELNDCCQASPIMKAFIKQPAQLFKTNEDIPILSDDKPVLDQMNKNAIMTWRKTMTKDITNEELKEGIFIFK